MMTLRNALLLLLFASVSVPALASDRNRATHPGAPEHITPCAPGVVYIQWKAGSSVISKIGTKGELLQSADAGAFERVARTLGVLEIVPFDAHAHDSIARALGIDRLYCLYYKNLSIDPHRAVAMLVATGEVEAGSVRYLFPVSNQPNDPLLTSQYALTKMNVLNAWNTTTGDTSIVIADVDCAINIDHEDLKNAVKINWGEVGLDKNGHDKRTNGIDDDSDGYVDNWEGWDVVGDVNASGGDAFQPNNDPRPRESGASHGTHTAGCIAATGNNNLGIAGVAYGCRILPIKSAGADYDNVAAGFEGIHYASTHGARIINCSWGGPITGFDTSVANLILDEAHARGALVVAAAGNGIPGVTVTGVNNDQNPQYPANGPYVLSVGATDGNDQATFFSNFGHSVGVWAPGASIESCDYPGNSAYSAEDGTSFAAPNACGVAALLWSMHTDWLPEYISRQLIATCDNVINTTDRPDYWGRLNAAKALSTPLVPGLVVSSYSLDGVVSDSLKANHTYDLKVTFKNVMGAGTKLSAVATSELGAKLVTVSGSLGSMAESATATGDFQITRNGVFSSGDYPVRFAVTDGALYSDTLTLYIPLSVVPGFVLERGGVYGSSVTRVSNTAAWAAFGQASSNGQIYNAEFANEQGSVWSDTSTLSDGTNPPYCVTALDSLTAFFGSGPPGGTAAVLSTTDGGKNFNTVDVSSFAAFVNTVHFFDPLNGILIGDPKSGRWGIGITNDGGQTWNPLSKPSIATGSVASWNNATAWVGKNGWYGTNSHQIRRTTDGGLTWKTVVTGYQHSLSVAFDDDAKHGMACFRPTGTSGSVTGTNGIMISNDSGVTWDTLQTLPVTGVAPGSVHFVPHSDMAIVTTNMGVYRTTDFGGTWSPIGIPVSYISDGADISVSRGHGEFVVSINSASNGVATYQEAMADDTTASVAPSEISAFSLEISPNPVRSRAQVSFSISSADRVRIELFDAIGRSMQVLADGWMPSGFHSLPVDASMLASGTYYVSFTSASGAHRVQALTVY